MVASISAANHATHLAPVGTRISGPLTGKAPPNFRMADGFMILLTDLTEHECIAVEHTVTQPSMREQKAPLPAAGSSTRPCLRRRDSMRSTMAGGVKTWPRAAW